MSGSCHVLLALWKLNMELFLLPVVGNISIYVKGQNYIQVKIIQRRVDPYFLFFLALIIHWIRAGYNWRKLRFNQAYRSNQNPGGGILPWAIWVCANPSGKVFAPSWSENGYKLWLFWSGIECGFRGDCSSVWTYLSFQSQMQWLRKKEKYANSKWMKNLFVCAPV